ncbi:MAG: AMP-binding protein [Burkholderiaceae bacterium]|jgi:acyl-CoA synthetase (AMP-forming)/AMP-acid ligase II|nr:AMP-binding protein [Burkholderiaceae bacterium]
MAITDFFDRGVLLNRNGCAFVLDELRWSYAEAHEITCKIGHALLGLGLPKETKAAVLSANHPLSWMCVLGLWRAGCTWVPVNPRSSLEEQEQLLDGFDVEVLFFQSYFSQSVEQLRAKCPKLKHLICIDGVAPGSSTLASWIADQPVDPPRHLCEPDDLAAIMPTGGTTGIPKGVMLTHRNLGVSIGYSIQSAHYAPQENIVNLAAAPMTHSAGFLSLPASARGGTVVVLTKPDPGALLNAIEAHGVTEFFLPPTVIYRLLETPGIERRNFSSMRYFMYGAAPMSVGKLKQALKVFGPVMFQGYGQTEAPGGIAVLRPGDHFENGEVASDNRLSACGLPSPFNTLAIMDFDGNALAQGQSGEICVRGDIVMKGYYKQPDKTAETIRNGWLHTGDIGHLDHQGFLHITDRQRDVIITGGFNVYPSEIEQVIWTHPAVVDCAVVGVPDDKWGEAVKAVVEVKPNAQVTAEEIIALCKEKLGSVKAPKSVDFLNSLPRSPVGKVIKKVLRDSYWQEANRHI